MRILSLHRLLALLAVLLLLGACAGPAGQRIARPTGTGSPLENADADTLAVEALGSWAESRDPNRALALIDRATRLDADRPELVWIHIRLCAVAMGCDPAPHEARLRKLDPDNGIAWLGPLSRARARQDGRAEAPILDAMSRARQFDLYWTRLMWRLTQSLNAARSAGRRDGAETFLTDSMNDVTGWLSRLDTPAFQPLTAACEPPSAQLGDAMPGGAMPGGAMQWCLRIAEAMQASDTTLVEGLGLGIAQRLVPPGSTQATSLENRISILSYRSQTAGTLMRSQVEREKFSAQVLQLMKKLRREQDVANAILRWAGEPLAPGG